MMTTNFDNSTCSLLCGGGTTTATTTAQEGEVTVYGLFIGIVLNVVVPAVAFTVAAGLGF
jgi:hypothetical protein